MKKILVLGVTGMLGHVLWNCFCESDHLEVFGTCRSKESMVGLFPESSLEKVATGIDVENIESLRQIILTVQPDWVVNCIGMVKQQLEADNAEAAMYLNGTFPHRLAGICSEAGCRLLHISTDCVFNGSKGNYSEDDIPDAEDIYGRSKALGEVADSRNCLTIRKSVIGHELHGKFGLLEWFLDRHDRVKGFQKAIYSGFPTIEFARIVKEFILPANDLHGIFHVSSDPVSKYELLQLVAGRYGVETVIEPDTEISIDRSLNSSRFQNVTGYIPPAWPELVEVMYKHFCNASFYANRKKHMR